MKILITGATGFIGQHLVKRILKEEGQVRVLVRRRTKVPILLDKRVESFYGDLTIKESLKGIFRGIDMVINAAGVLGKWGISSKELLRGNVLAVRNLLEVCLSSNIQHFIHLSTCGVSGPLEYDGADEGYPCQPSSPYQKTKYQGERVALEMAAQYNIPLTIIRPTFTYGPGDLHRLPLFRLIKKGFFVFIGKGQGTLHPVYIDDLVEGIMLSKNRPPCQATYIVGGDKIVTVRELVYCLAQILGVKLRLHQLPLFIAWPLALVLEMAGKVGRFEPPLTRSRIKLFTNHQGYSITKARKELGYKPQVELYQGMVQTIQWYQNKGYL
jgi:nucleoside-diphosphate-sugar epimerase